MLWFGIERARAQVIFLTHSCSCTNKKRQRTCFAYFSCDSPSLYLSLFSVCMWCLHLSSFIEFLPLMAWKKALYISYMYKNKPLALSFLCLSCIFNALHVVLRWCAVFQLCPSLCVSKREKSTFSRFIHMPDSLKRTKHSDKYKNEKQQKRRMTWPSSIFIYILHNPTKWKNLQMKMCSA